MWFARPVTGGGAGTYGDLHPQYQQSVVSAATDAHNVYVQVLAELGLPGAMALAALVLGLLLGLVRGLFVRPDLVPVAFGVAGLLIHFGLDIDARYPALVLLLAVLAGMLVAPWRQRQPEPVRLGWPLLALLVVVPIAMLYQSDVAAQRGKAAQMDEQYAPAADWFDQADNSWFANPDWISAAGINRLALAVSGSGELDSHATEIDLALDTVHRAEQADPYDGQHWQLEGRILQAKTPADTKAVRAAFEHALQLDPLNHPGYALDLARAELAYHDAAAARRTAEHMLALYPPDVVANRQADPTLQGTLAELAALVGNLDLQVGHIPEARHQARRALDLQAQNLAARALLHQVQKAEAPTQP
jgi:tetratricopeptide (TPR) repeat protein